MLKLHEFTPKQSLSGSNGGDEAEVTTIHLDGTPLNEAGRGHGRNDTSSSSVSAAGKVIPVSILMTSSHDDEEEEEERKSSGFQKSSEYVGVLKGEGNPMHGGKAASSSYYSDGTPAKQSRKPEGGPSALIGNQQPPRGFVGDDDKYFIV